MIHLLDDIFRRPNSPCSPVEYHVVGSGQPMLEFAAAAIRTPRDANLAVPDDVSVIGFEDIQLAAYDTPRLTTIRQPLRDMGETAVRILLQRLHGFRDYPIEFAVPPELIIRESTAVANPKRRL